MTKKCSVKITLFICVVFLLHDENCVCREHLWEKGGNSSVKSITKLSINNILSDKNVPKRYEFNFGM